MRQCPFIGAAWMNIMYDRFAVRLCENSLFYMFTNVISILAAHKDSGGKLL